MGISSWIAYLAGLLVDYTVRPSLYVVLAGAAWYAAKKLAMDACARHVFKAAGITGRVFGVAFVKASLEDTVEEVMKHIPVEPGEKVVDLGCGPGNSFKHLFKKFEQNRTQNNVVNTLDAVDWSEEVLDSIKSDIQSEELEQNNVTLHLMDMTSPLFSKGSFDLALVLNTSMMVKDLPKFFQNVADLLKSNGRMAICWVDSELSFRTGFIQAGHSRGLYHIRANAYMFELISFAFTIEKKELLEDQSTWVVIARRK